MSADLRYWLSVVVTGFALAACQDAGTLPDPGSVPTTAAPQRGALTGVAFTEYVCYTSVATPGGEHAYRYGRLPLRFPAGPRHPGNATHRYRYRMVDGNGKVLRVANCVIPRSDEAVAMMNRRFGVPDTDGQAQIQGCVSDGVCQLDPIVVDPGDGDTCDPYQEADWSCDDGGGTCMTSVSDPDGESVSIQGCETGGSGGPAPGGGTGGGGGSDPGEPEAPDDGTGRPACERDANKKCITRDVTPEEWTQLGQAIEAIPEYPAECKGAKDALRSLYAEGREADRIRFWDGYDKYWDADKQAYQQRLGENLSDTQGRFIEYDSYHIWHKPDLLVHEGLHAWLGENPDNEGLVTGGNEDWVENMAQTCSTA